MKANNFLKLEAFESVAYFKYIWPKVCLPGTIIYNAGIQGIAS